MNNSANTDWLERITRALESIRTDVATSGALARRISPRTDTAAREKPANGGG